MNKLYRINMSTSEIKYERVKEEYKFFGGRGLIAKTMLDEVDPLCDPIGPENKLLICTGVFAGTSISTSNRLSIGGKSPLTKNIKEANSGGTAATFLANHGIKMLNIEGVSETWKIIFIDKAGKVSFVEAKGYVGLNNYDLCEKIFNDFSQDISVMSIGTAGERLYRNSAVMITEFGSNEPCRAAARGGLGAVMGSKKIKAIVIEKPLTPFKLSFANEELFKSAKKKFTEILISNKALKARSKYGTLGILDTSAKLGVLPVRNFRGEKDERTNQINAEALYEKLQNNGGKAGVACQAGCVIRCSNRYHNDNGEYITSGLEYETVGLCGSNLDIFSFDTIAQISRICDDIGVDTIETGAALGVCMEVGRISWGDEKGVFELLDEMKEGSEFGKILGNGTEFTGEYLNVHRIPVARSQAFPAYDPRGAKGMGISYATSAMGADHTAGITLGQPGTEYLKQSIRIQISLALVDNTMCLFAFGAIAGHPEGFKTLGQLFEGLYGSEFDVNKQMAIGMATLKFESDFTRKAGFKPEEEHLPKFLYKEKSPLADTKYDVPQEQFAMVAVQIDKMNEQNPFAKL